MGLVNIATGERLLTEHEAAAIYGCCVRTLQRLRYAGEGPSYVRFGKRKVLYSRRDLVEYLEARRFKSPVVILQQVAA
jgi:hypothetical protein